MTDSSAFMSSFTPPMHRESPVAAVTSTFRRIFAPSAIANPTLPQSVPQDQISKRNKELAENQKLYVYESPPTIPGIAFIKGPVNALPGQEPTFWWKAKAAAVGARVVLNFAGNPLKAASLFIGGLFTNQNDEEKVKQTIESFRNKIDATAVADKVMQRFSDARLEGGSFEEKNPILAPYRDMYRILEEPKIGSVFLEDRVFSRLRVAGFNPLSLQRVFTEDNLPFPIDDSRLPNSSDTVERAIREKRLYFNDFSFLAGLQQQINSNKICVVSKSIFVVPPGGGDLEIVGIEADGYVHYPPTMSTESSINWYIAKMALNNADAIHHELIAHLGRTHLLVEPFVAATMRQLPSSHPVHVLLKPHFEGTVFINDTASKNLVAPGGDVDRIFAGEIDSVMAWCGQEVINFNFNECMPEEDMRIRGVDDPILTFPYREDATEHFDAMYEWVYSYLSHYYKSDQDILMDLELQAWVAELVDPSRGRVKGFGDLGNGKVTSIQYLARALTFVIFSGSVQHAAVNFPQKSLMSYAPAMAGGLYSRPPKPDEPATMKQWVETLTPIKTAIEQVEILCVIGAVYYTELGKYRRSEMPRTAEIQKAHKRYMARLEKIDQRIVNREKNAELPYEYMRPAYIPQSINI